MEKMLYSGVIQSAHENARKAKYTRGASPRRVNNETDLVRDNSGYLNWGLYKI